MMLCASVMLLAASVRAGSLSPDVEQTFGSRRYHATSASVEIGDTYYARPGAEVSRSETSNGTRQAYSLDFGRGRHESRRGLDERGKLGVSVEETFHRDRFQFVQTGPVNRNGGGPGPSGGGDAGGDFRAGVVSARTNPIVIRQTEAGLSSSVELWDLTLSGSGSKSFYDKDLSGVHAREIEAQEVLGTDILVQGYAD